MSVPMPLASPASTIIILGGSVFRMSFGHGVEREYTPAVGVAPMSNPNASDKEWENGKCKETNATKGVVQSRP